MNLILTLLYITLQPFSWSTVDKYSDDKIFKEIDEVVANRIYYQEQNQKQIDLLKLKMNQANNATTRYSYCNSLVEIYTYFSLDSALLYSEKEIALAKALNSDSLILSAQLNKASILGFSGQCNEALNLLETVDMPLLSSFFKIKIYNTYCVLYSQLATYTPLESEKEHYTMQSKFYRDKIIASANKNDNIYAYSAVERLIDKGDYEEASNLIHNKLDGSNDPRLIARLLNSYAYIYSKKGHTQLWKRWLAITAITDLKKGVREYMALRTLAFAFYEDGDTQRAFDYLRCSLEDAIACKAMQRTVEISKLYPVINHAYQLQITHEKKITNLTLTFISLLSIALLITVIYIYRQIRKMHKARRALKCAYDSLHDTNLKLKESNRIKEEYLVQYLAQCSTYIDKMEEYRRHLARLAMKSKLQELFTTIKSDEHIEKEKQNFYLGFDRTFLNIFPSFVEAFNALLQPNYQIIPKKEHLLNTELRIFALIRLGITDTTQIASFLRYSTSTVYNYRSRTRNKAKGDKEDFEKNVMDICF